MIIIDTDLDTLIASRPTDPSKFFYMDFVDRWEIYCVINSMLLRYIYTKNQEVTEEPNNEFSELGIQSVTRTTERMDDTLFFDKYLKDAKLVRNISHVNEEPWRELILSMNDKLEKILEKIGNGNEQ